MEQNFYGRHLESVFYSNEMHCGGARAAKLFILGADVNKEEKNRFWKEKGTVCVKFTRASSGTYLERV